MCIPQAEIDYLFENNIVELKKEYRQITGFFYPPFSYIEYISAEQYIKKLKASIAEEKKKRNVE